MDHTELLAELLTSAAEAHHVYQTEELGGVNDEQWAQWYAKHMTEALAARGLRITKAAKSD